MPSYKDRLEETNRTCDGCGDTIGRWTKKCVYDDKLNRVYCNKNGCADKVNEAPLCVACSTAINPFEGEIVEFLAVEVIHYCSECSDKGLNLPLPAGVEEVDLPPIGHTPLLTKEVIEWYEKGPFVAIKTRYLYKVVKPLGDRVISVGTDSFLDGVIELTARHNRRFHTDIPVLQYDDEGNRLRMGEGEGEMEPATTAREAPKVTVSVEEPWLYIKCPPFWSELPSNFTKIEEEKTIKTRLGTKISDTIIKWFRKRGVEIEDQLN